jgi:hypothetical protein
MSKKGTMTMLAALLSWLTAPDIQARGCDPRIRWY